jgi:hypothetical protein
MMLDVLRRTPKQYRAHHDSNLTTKQQPTNSNTSNKKKRAMKIQRDE